MPDAIPFFEGPTNLSLTERTISLVAGLGLAAAAVKPRPNPLLNVLALVGGAVLTLRGATGHCPIKASLGSSSHDRIAAGAGSSGRIASRS